MTKTLTTQYKKVQDGVLTGAQKVWLAGLGAVSLAEEKGGELLGDLEQRSSRLFDDLVERGRGLEHTGRDRVEELSEQTSSTIGEWQGRIEDGIEGRLDHIIRRLGVPSRKQIRDLSQRVESLTAQVEAVQKGTWVEKKEETAAIYHLLPLDTGWQLREEGADEATSEHPTKDGALAAGRRLAQAHEPSRLVVHKQNGSIQASYSYGGDA